MNNQVVTQLRTDTQTIGKAIPAPLFHQFSATVKAQHPELAKVQFINACGVLKAARPLGELFGPVAKVYAEVITTSDNLEVIARHDWDRIDQRRRLASAKLYRQRRSH